MTTRALRIKRENTGWLGIRIMCPSGTTCLGELVLFKDPNKRVGLVQRGIIIISLNVTFARHDIATIAHLALSNTSSTRPEYGPF